MAPKEGERDPKGRQYVAGRWRTPDEIHSMARHSVVETLKLYGIPLSRHSLMRMTGLAELNTQRALDSLVKDGEIIKAHSGRGAGRYYVPGDDDDDG